MIEIPFKSSVVSSLGHVVFFTTISQMLKHIGFTKYFWNEYVFLIKYLYKLNKYKLN